MNCGSKATEETAKKTLGTEHEHIIDFKLSKAEESIISNKNIKLRRNEENEKKSFTYRLVVINFTDLGHRKFEVDEERSV